MSAKYFRDASNNYLGATSGEAMAGGIEVASAPSDARMVLANGAWGLPAGVVIDAVGLDLWTGTQAAYDALTPVSTTLYFIQ